MSDAIRSNTLESDTNDTLPVGWRQASLAEVAEIRISNVDKKSAVGEIPVRLCNYIDVYKNVYITAALDFMEATATPSEIARFCVDLGDVMITKDSETPDDIGVPAVAIWSDPKLVCGYHLALFKPHRDQIDPVFLAKQLRLPRIAAYYGRLACGSTRYGLSNSGIARTPLRFPPLPQQRKIARILTTVDNLIEKTEALIAKYQAIKQGMMHDLFTRGVDEHGHLRPQYEEAPELYKQSELGWIPKEWNVQRLGGITLKIADRDHFTPAYVEYGVPMISPKDFVRFDRISFANCQFITAEAHERNRRKTDIGPDDVVFTRIGAALGKACLVTADMPEFSLLHSAVMIRANTDRILPMYLVHVLKSFYFQSQIGSEIQSIGVPDLGLDKINAFRIKVPKLNEQGKCAAILNAIDASIASEDRELTALQQQKTGLMQDLLTGKVRVKVDEAEEVAAHA